MSFLGLDWDDVRDAILRAVATATVWGNVGWVADTLGFLPGPVRAAAEAFVVATPGIARGEPVAQAMFTEYTYQAARAASAYGLQLTVSPAMLATVGSKLGVAIPTTTLSREAADLLGSELAERAFRPVVELFKDVHLSDAADRALSYARDAGVSLDDALAYEGLSPDELAERAGIREDVAAFAANRAAGADIYIAAEFDPMTGRRSLDPVLLRLLLDRARAQGHVERVASLERQIARAESAVRLLAADYKRFAGEIPPDPVIQIFAAQSPELLQAWQDVQGKASAWAAFRGMTAPASTSVGTTSEERKRTHDIALGVVIVAAIGAVAWWHFSEKKRARA